MGRYKDIATEIKFNNHQTLEEVDKTMKTFRYINDKGEFVTTQVIAITSLMLHELGLDSVEETTEPLKTNEINMIMNRVTGLTPEEITNMGFEDKFRLLELIMKETEENTYVN